MAKLTKDELIAKINEKLSDNSELAVELMEDITDSFDTIDTSEYEKQIEEEKAKYEDLLQRYKDRFVSAEVIEEKEEVEEPAQEDAEVIDETVGTVTIASLATAKVEVYTCAPFGFADMAKVEIDKESDKELTMTRKKYVFALIKHLIDGWE